MSKKQPAAAPGVTQLGKQVALPGTPDEAELERVANPHADTRYVARFTAPEFTCLCPVTGQPDFAHFVIDYVPKAWLIESKSLKLYLASFRNHGAFHEDCTVRSASASPSSPNRTTSGSVATGFRAAECRSTSSGRWELYRTAFGCRIKELCPTEGGADLPALSYYHASRL